MVSGATDKDITKVGCGSYEPIKWSSTDTPETIAQIKAHNQVYVDQCGE